MVVKGDYEATEQLLHRAVDNGLFGPYIHSQDYVPEWSRILPCIDEDPCHRPGMRGGHQMCIDVSIKSLNAIFFTRSDRKYVIYVDRQTQRLFTFLAAGTVFKISTTYGLTLFQVIRGLF